MRFAVLICGCVFWICLLALKIVVCFVVASLCGLVSCIGSWCFGFESVLRWVFLCCDWWCVVCVMVAVFGLLVLRFSGLFCGLLRIWCFGCLVLCLGLVYGDFCCGGGFPS